MLTKVACLLMLALVMASNFQQPVLPRTLRRLLSGVAPFRPIPEG